MLVKTNIEDWVAFTLKEARHSPDEIARMLLILVREVSKITVILRSLRAEQPGVYVKVLGSLQLNMRQDKYDELLAEIAGSKDYSPETVREIKFDAGWLTVVDEGILRLFKVQYVDIKKIKIR